MMKNSTRKFSVPGLLLIIICIISPSLLSEVTLDGTVGAAGSLPGPNYQITEDLGQRAGGNLFHSFGQFNLNNAESATFSGSTGIQNVISRVTGGQRSNIDGAIRSTIPGANLYFLNPAGVIFGKNATLDIQGSFHASTANYLGFKDGVHLDNSMATPNPILTTAAPKAFGFLGKNPAAISIFGGTNSILGVPTKSTLSIIGGDLTIEDSSLYTPGGQINLVSIGSTGEVIINESGVNTASFSQMGNIHISHNPNLPRIKVEPGGTKFDVDVSADAAGKIFIRGGQLVMDNSYIAADTTNGDGGNIDIALTGDLNINGVPETPSRETTPQSGITAYTSGSGKAGNILLDVDGLKLTHGTRIDSTTLSAGNGGDLLIDANTILLEGNESKVVPRLLTTTTETGYAGKIDITSNTLEVSNQASIQSVTSGEGDTGDLSIKTNSLNLHDRAIIANVTKGNGNTGDLSITPVTTSTNTDSRIDLYNTVLITNTTSGDGNTGNLFIKANNINVRSDAKISISTSGAGNSGNLKVKADTLTLSGFSSGISSFNSGAGNAGDLTISSTNLDIHDGAQILVSSESGKSGDLSVEANSIALSGGEVALIEEKEGFISSGIKSNAFKNGEAGNVLITSDKLDVRNGAQISVSTGGSGNTGDLFVKSDEILLTNDKIFLVNGNSGKVLTGINSGVFDTQRNGSATGNSGNLTVQSQNLLVNNGALININNLGQGKTGNLNVKSTNILLNHDLDGVSPGGISIAPSDETPNSKLNITASSGDLSVKAENLIVQNGTTISANNISSGKGSNIIVYVTKSILLDGNSSPIEIEGKTVTFDSGITNQVFSTGEAGNLTVQTKNLQVLNGAEISTSTAGLANAGNLKINVDQLQVNNAKIIAGTKGAGNAGNVTVKANTIELRESANIGATTSGTGNSGDLTITAEDILLDNSLLHSGILRDDSDSSKQLTAVQSGNIEITLTDSFRVQNGSYITTVSTKPNAGNITINNGNRLLLSDSNIVTSVTKDKGKGGNIRITTPIVALNSSNIIANAAEGRGGNIDISGLVIESTGSKITASSILGMDGVVNLNPITNINGSISVLPSTFINTTNQLRERCATRAGIKSSSFVVKGRGGIPIKPGELTPSDFLDYTTINETLSQYPERDHNAIYPEFNQGILYSAMRDDCSQQY